MFHCSEKYFFFSENKENVKEKRSLFHLYFSISYLIVFNKAIVILKAHYASAMFLYNVLKNVFIFLFCYNFQNGIHWTIAIPIFCFCCLLEISRYSDLVFCMEVKIFLCLHFQSCLSVW
jgi:hypothetical protein